MRISGLRAYLCVLSLFAGVKTAQAATPSVSTEKSCCACLKAGTATTLAALFQKNSAAGEDSFPEQGPHENPFFLNPPDSPSEDAPPLRSSARSLSLRLKTGLSPPASV